MQQQFLIQMPKKEKIFGGSSLKKGRRKTARPLDPKLPLHLVLRANVNSKTSLLVHLGWVEFYLQKFGQRFGVKIYRKATVSNHIHLLLKFPNRECYIKFVRAFTGALSKKFEVEWSCRPFSRIVTWGRDFRSAGEYVQQNELEAFGVVPYKPRAKGDAFLLF